MNLYEEIIEKSKLIDIEFQKMSDKELQTLSINYSVQDEHPRSKDFSEYTLKVCSFDECVFPNEPVYIVDKGLSKIDFLIEFLKDKKYFFIESSEAETKNLVFAKKFIKENLQNEKEVVGIGGGLVLNVVAYIAESLQANLVYVPTSIISMSDSVIGGKVRINSTEGGLFKKHGYKSYYEPNFIFIEPMFLETFPSHLVNINLAEVVKHGMYQSRALLAYIASSEFNMKNKNDILRVILWAASLKKVCLDVDPNETDEGADMVLRAGHTISDKLEEVSGLTMLHGESVTRGVYQQATEEENELLPLLDEVYKKLDLISYIK